MAMISSPNMVGLRTSMAASRTMSSLGRVPPSWASRRTQFSTMITLESTIRPKSIAPRLIRLADRPVASMMLAAKSIDSGIASATIRPPRRLPEHGQQHDDHQDAAGQQVVQHGAERLVDQVGAVVERLDRDARGKALLELGDLGLHVGRRPCGRSGR